MTNRRLVKHAVIATLILALAGCTLTRLLTSHLEKPTFTYKGSELVEVSQSGVVVNFLFAAHNPNEAGLENVACSYELLVDGKKFLKGDDLVLKLNPKGDTDITIPATIRYKDLVPVLGSIMGRILSGQSSFPVTINAVFSGKPAILVEKEKKETINFEMSFTKTVDIPWPRKILGQ